MQTIKRGSRGDAVKQLQELLGGLTVDGIFGPATEKAVKAYQEQQGLTVDGIVGALTWARLNGEEIHVNAQPPDFKQYDSRWGSIMYSSHGDKKQTIRNSGCGPTAMADILAYLVDSTITPPILAEKAVAWGDRSYSSGTNWSFFTHIRDAYGLHMVKTTNLTTLKQYLDKGAYAVVSFTKSKWTTGGHYCCIWKYDDTYFYINDPASAKASRAKGTYSEVKAARKAFFCFWRDENEG